MLYIKWRTNFSYNAIVYNLTSIFSIPHSHLLVTIILSLFLWVTHKGYFRNKWILAFIFHRSIPTHVFNKILSLFIWTVLVENNLQMLFIFNCCWTSTSLISPEIKNIHQYNNRKLFKNTFMEQLLIDIFLCIVRMYNSYLQTDLGDTVDWVPAYHNKVSITVKRVKRNAWFPSVY